STRRSWLRWFVPRIRATPFCPMTYGRTGTLAAVETFPHSIWASPPARREIWIDPLPALPNQTMPDVAVALGIVVWNRWPPMKHRILWPEWSCPAANQRVSPSLSDTAGNAASAAPAAASARTRIAPTPATRLTWSRVPQSGRNRWHRPGQQQGQRVVQLPADLPVGEASVGVELLRRVAHRDLGVDDARAHRAEDLAHLGLGPHGAEHADARADHGDGLVAEDVRGDRARGPLEGVLERAPGG